MNLFRCSIQYCAVIKIFWCIKQVFCLYIDKTTVLCRLRVHVYLNVYVLHHGRQKHHHSLVVEGDSCGLEQPGRPFAPSLQ